MDGVSGGLLPSKDAIKEIKVNPERFSADRDMWWGGIEIVTRPGAEKLHGSIGITESEAALNSRNPYAANKAGYLNRLWSANAGSSLRNRLSYNLSLYHNIINNTALINAVTLDPLTLADLPVRSTVVLPRADDPLAGRFDYSFSQTNTALASWQYLRSRRDNNGVGRYSLQSRGYSSRNSGSQLRLGDTAIFGSTVLMENRLAFTDSEVFRSGNRLRSRSRRFQRFQWRRFTDRQHDNAYAYVRGSGRDLRDLRPARIEVWSPQNGDSRCLLQRGGTFSFFGVADAPVLDFKLQPVNGLTAPISSLEQYRRTVQFQQLGSAPERIRALGGGASQFYRGGRSFGANGTDG